MTTAGQAIDIRDTSASLITRQQFFDCVEWLVAVVGGDRGALVYSLPAPVPHEIELSGKLLADHGAPEAVPKVRIRASNDTVSFSSVAFALQDGIDPILHERQLPPLNDLLVSPLKPFLASLEWTAVMKI